MEKGIFFKRPHVWAFTTYFAEGLPYTVVRMVSSVFFQDMRVRLEAIGLTSLFGIPWVIEFLWGPLIDQYGTKRKWILVMRFLLVLLFMLVAGTSSLPSGVKVIAGLLFVDAFLSATHDIAIDGYYMETLDKTGQAKFVGYRDGLPPGNDGKNWHYCYHRDNAQLVCCFLCSRGLSWPFFSTICFFFPTLKMKE